MNSNIVISRILKPLVFAAALTPFLVLSWRAYHEDLGANPISEVLNETGIWTIRFVMLALSVTPLRRLTGWSRLSTFRRPIGLFAFFYGFLHFFSYFVLDQALAFDDILADIAKRPFITVGFLSFVLMIPLAATSTRGWIRRLGGKRWNLIHRLIYLTGAGGVIHYYWRVKADVLPPLMYAGILLVLFSVRLWYLYEKKRTAAPAVRTPTEA